MKDIARTPRRDFGMSVFGDDFDNLFEGFFRPMRLRGFEGAESSYPAADVTERDTDYLVKADLPGVKKEDIHVTVENNVLSISAETKQEKEQKEGGRVIRQERCYGKYVRNLALNHKIDNAHVKAAYKDGVLELILPKVKEEIAKRIEVEVK